MGIEDFLKQEEQRFIRENLMSDEVFDFIRENTMPFNELMAYYRCAIMEVETKFKVLNEQFSLQYDRNPIETIKTRIKSTEGIIKKANKKNIPFTMESIEQNIRDIAGMSVHSGYLYRSGHAHAAERSDAHREKGLYQES